MDSIDDQGHAGPLVTAGSRLRSARETAGLSRSDIASQTKIAERHLLAIEEDRFGDLAARTYAVGFARAYARALHLDEAEIAELVRRQLDAEDNDRPVHLPSFEPGDPARVPPVRVAWLAAGGAVVVIVLLLVFWSSFLSPEGKLPDLLPEHTPAPVASASAGPRPIQAAPASGPVVLTATEDNIWLSVTDAAGAKLFDRTLAKGESWTVPAQAQGAQLRTGRPDALQVSVGGKAIAPLADKPTTMSGVSLAAADLLARGRPAVAPAAAAPATPAPVPSQVGPQPQAAPDRVRPSATGPSAAQTSRPVAVPTSRPSARPTVQPSSAPTVAPSSPPATSAPAPTATQQVSTVSG